MKYDCNICNYSTVDWSNWTRHKKGKSHLKKMQDNEENMRKSIEIKQQRDTAHSSSVRKLICLYCDADFATRQSLSRHKNHRCSKNNVDELKKKIVNLESENKYLKSFAEQAVNTACDAISVVKSTTDTLNCIYECI